MVSHEPRRWNFSENTNLSEVLVIARKREQANEDERVNCINLWRQPRNAVEALGVARALLSSDPPDVQNDPGALEVAPSGEKLGEALSVPWVWLRGRLWSFPCTFAQAELVRALFHLLDGKLYLPGEGLFPKRGRIPLCALQELGELGFDRRDIHDGFTLARSRTSYPAFWGHDAEAVLSMAQRPNRYLNPRSQPAQGRPLRHASDLWPKAGQVLIAERLRLNTQRLTAVFVERKVLSNVWWPLATELSEERQKALVLWLNSTLSLLMLSGHREETEGAFIGFKKPVLKQMPVLDVRNIGDPALKKLAQAFDQFANDPLLPFPEIANDPTRTAIDKAVADILGLPDFGILRELIAREPILCLNLDRLMLRTA